MREHRGQYLGFAGGDLVTKLPTAKLKTNGVVLWQGASELDGAPIVLIATGFTRKSANDKTGDKFDPKKFLDLI